MQKGKAIIEGVLWERPESDTKILISVDGKKDLIEAVDYLKELYPNAVLKEVIKSEIESEDDWSAYSGRTYYVHLEPTFWAIDWTSASASRNNVSKVVVVTLETFKKDELWKILKDLLLQFK